MVRTTKIGVTARRRWPAVLVACLLLASACRNRGKPAPTPTPTPSPAPSASPAPSPGATAAEGAGPSKPCGAERSEARSSGAPYPAPRDRHVFVVVLENHALDQIVGDARAPYLNELARACGLATDYDAITHPSLPNYIALMSGGLNGITTNCTDCHTGAANLADQLEAASLTWRAYAEAMPEPCFPGATASRYVKRHVPFLYFDSIRGDGPRCRRSVVPLAELEKDLAHGDVPNFSLVVPDMCHNMHDCGVPEGDTWLRGFLPTILRSRAYREGGIVVVTFDEGSGKSNRIPTIVLTPGMRPNTRCGEHQDHYSMLRTLEDLFGLPPLGAAAQRTSMLRCFSLPEPSPAR